MKGKWKIILLVIFGIGCVGAMTEDKTTTSPIFYIILAALSFIFAFTIFIKNKQNADNNTKKSYKNEVQAYTSDDINELGDSSLAIGRNDMSWSKTKKAENIDKSFRIGLYTFGIDNNDKKFYINKLNKTYKYNFKDLIDFEVTCITGKEKTKIKGNMISTVAGGLIFGPLGALAGSVKSRKIKKYKKPDKYIIDIYLNDLNLNHIESSISKNHLHDVVGYLKYIQNNI